MLNEIINNPDLDKYLAIYETGQRLFIEGDDTQDLYILVEGELDVLKGNKIINEITEKGALFGEMSFLLRTNRTATVKAKGDVKALCIPKEEITSFLHAFPVVGTTITWLLAERLGETTQILYGLKEFCDQLPDAVIFTDKDGKILTWNSAAEKLYGGEWDHMLHKSADVIYEEPEAYRSFIEEVQSKYPVTERVLKIRHPEKGTRYVSTSTTVLYDGQHNFQGVLSLGRDVTDVKKLEMRHRRAKYWFVPSVIFLALLSVSIFFAFPYLSKRHQSLDVKKVELRKQLAKDYFLLKSLLIDCFASEDRSKANQVMKDFFGIQGSTGIPYTGLVLLDENKKVFNAYSVGLGTGAMEWLGESYAGIAFQGSEKSLHSILTLYRVDNKHPMGRKGIEVAFEMSRDGRFLGWLVFQMNVDLLQKEYRIDGGGLKKFRFNKP